MSLAKETREAVRRRPFLWASLRAGVVNYTAAARYLAPDVDVGSEEDGLEAIATALRRYRESLPDDERVGRNARVSMKSGLGRVESNEDALLSVTDTFYGAGSGSLTGVLATSDVDAGVLADVIGRLRTAGVAIDAAGGVDESLVVVVERRDGPIAVRAVEDALERGTFKE